MTTDPNVSVRLRTGAEVPASAARATYLALNSLVKGELPEVMALVEAREIARDPAHEPFGKTGEVLRELALIDSSGAMQSITRDIILAAVEGDDTGVRIVWPFAPADA